MKFSSRFFIFIAVLSIGIGYSYGQSEWSLQKCIDHALENNLSIKQGKLTVSSNQNSLLRSKEARLPNFSGFAGSNMNFGRNINPLDNTYVIQKVQSSQFGLSSNLVLFNGFSINNTIKLNSINEEASKKDLEVISNSISLQIATQYLEVLFNKEAIKVIDARINSSEKQLERANELYQAGSVNQSNVLEMEAKLSSDKLDRVNAENSLSLSMLSLANLLQIPDVSKFSIVSPELKIPSEAILEGSSEIYDKASKVMPEIELSILRYKAAIMQQNISKAGYYPSLSLNANVNTLYSDNFKIPTSPTTFETIPFSTQINNNLGQSIGLNLSVPLYSRGTIRSNVKQAKITSEQQKLNIQKAENDLYTSVANAVANYKAAKSKYGALTEAYNSQLKNYDFNLLRFDAGALATVDLIISKTNMEIAEANLIQGKYDLIFRKVLLDFYRGNPLKLD